MFGGVLCFFKKMLKLNFSEAKAGERKCLKVDEYLGVAFLEAFVSNAHQPPWRKLLKIVMLNKNPREASKKLSQFFI